MVGKNRIRFKKPPHFVLLLIPTCEEHGAVLLVRSHCGGEWFGEEM